MVAWTGLKLTNIVIYDTDDRYKPKLQAYVLLYSFATKTKL